MQVLLITATIIWSLTSANVRNCNGYSASELDGCYKSDITTVEQNGHIVSRTERDKEIFVKDETSRPKDFIFYHEVGHHFFNLDVIDGDTPFKYEKKEPTEKMAENFALYIYEYKYPETYIKPKAEYQKWFEEKCPKECVEKVIGVKVPGMKYPIEPFGARI